MTGRNALDPETSKEIEQRICGDHLGRFRDDFYSDLMAIHDGLTFEDSVALNARLVLILANLVGDKDLLGRALGAARDEDRSNSL